jgi:hypothetical protein
MPADAASYTHASCSQCDYPFTPSSRNDAGDFVCPECGSVFPVYNFSAAQLTHIAAGDCASDSRWGRTIALSGYMCMVILAFMLAAPLPMPFDLHTLFVLGAFAIVSLMIMQHRVVAALSAIGAPLPARMHLGVGIATMGGLVLWSSASSLRGPTLLTLVLIQLPLFIGATIILADTLARARVFPIEPVRKEGIMHARRSVRLMLVTGVAHCVLSFYFAPQQEQAWYTLMAFTCGSSILAISINNRALEALHKGAKPWLTPARVDAEA